MNDLTSSAFYSEPTPEAIGSPTLKETGAIDAATQIPLTAATPAYSGYADSGTDSFAPSAVVDPTFQAALQDPQAPPPQTGIPLWLILGAGALLVMFLRKKN
jgi:hypothetical protein